MNLIIKPMDEESSKEIAAWQYEYPYSIYNLGNDSETIAELMNGTYYKALAGNGNVTGFFCFGESAQVPSNKCMEAYGNNDYLDIGLGMNPQICGKGIGSEFLKAGMLFAENTFGIGTFRLTVAEFNTRAIKVYERAGFEKFLSFEIKRLSGPMTFIVMIQKKNK